jgi:vitamin B12 transporter
VVFFFILSKLIVSSLKKLTMSKKIVTLIALGAALNAIAQQDTSTTKSIDEVVVTATKFPIKTSATGKVITVITKQQLQQSGGKDLSQILNEQVGIQINGANSNAGKDKSIYLRGARVEHTLITIDGVPVYDASGIGSNFDIRNLSVDLVERVEILKGSQSTLYGSDAIAGVINIITKKNDSNKDVNVAGTLSYGSYNTMRGNAGINGKLKSIDYNLGYSYLKTDGINEAASTVANADKDNYKQEAFNANFGITASKNIVIKPYLRYIWLNGNIDQGAFTDELDFSYTQKSFQTGVKNEITIGKTRLNVLYNYNKIERTYIDDSTSSQNGYDKFTKGIYNGNEHFVDAYSNFALCKTTKLTVGADYRTSTTNQYYNSIGFFGPYKTALSGDSIKQNQLGIYAALNYNNNLGFNLEVGGRFNNHSVYGNNTVFNINPSYQVNDDVKVFANISSAYRTPSLYQLYSEYGNKNLKPEVALSTEIGLQHYFENKTIKTQLVLFSRDVKDVHFFYYNNTTFQSQYINQDKQKDLGLEFETQIQASKNTSIKLFYTYVEGFTKTKDNTGKEFTIDGLLRRPANCIGLNIGTKPTNKLFASINLQWFGERNDTYFDNITFATKNVTLHDYALIDIYADYSLLKNKFKLFVNARNITNSNYQEIVGYNTMGTNFYGGVKFNF